MRSILITAIFLFVAAVPTASAQDHRPIPPARREDGRLTTPTPTSSSWDRDRDRDPFEDEWGDRHRPDFNVPLQVNAWSDSSRYRFGESVRMAVRVNRDSWVWILSEDDSRRVKMLYPNWYERGHYVQGGRILWLPSRSWDLPAGPPAGLRRITILALDARAMEPRRLRYAWSREAPFPFIDDPNLLIDDILDSARDARRRHSSSSGSVIDWVIGPDDPSAWWLRQSSPPSSNWNDSQRWGDEHFISRTDLFIRVIADGHGQGGDWDHLRPGPVPPQSTDPNAGKLRVTSSPANAEVYLNGRFHGYTPVELPLNPRRYEMVVKRRGYRPFVQDVQIERRRTNRISLRLERE